MDLKSRARRWLGVEEHRNYTDAITQAIIEQASGEPAGSSGALEIAAGQVSRAFASASVSGRDAGRFDAESLALIGRDLIERGDSVWEIRSSKLVWVQSYDVQSDGAGGWLYAVGTGRARRSARVLHLRYALDPVSGRGIGPMQRAPALDRFASGLERRLGEEGGSPVGYLLPIPAGGADEEIEEFKSDLAKLSGKIAVVETTSAGWGDGRAASPQQDYAPKRLGGLLPAGNIDGFRAARETVLSACGVPTELVERSDGTGQREAWRRFLHGTIQPLGQILVDAAQVAGMDISISWERLMASDIAGRARAFQSMVGAGMDIERAASVSGILQDDS